MCANHIDIFQPGLNYLTTRHTLRRSGRNSCIQIGNYLKAVERCFSFIGCFIVLSNWVHRKYFRRLFKLKIVILDIKQNRAVLQETYVLTTDLFISLKVKFRTIRKTCFAGNNFFVELNANLPF